MRAQYLYGSLGLLRAQLWAPEANTYGQHCSKDFEIFLSNIFKIAYSNASQTGVIKSFMTLWQKIFDSWPLFFVTLNGVPDVVGVNQSSVKLQ